MLTQAQQKLIWDVIPEEGHHIVHYDGQRFSYPAPTINNWARRPLKGIKPAPEGEKKAYILHGPPGSGKTDGGAHRLESKILNLNPHVAPICYDEFHGGIYAIPDYLENLKKIAPEYQAELLPVNKASIAEREALWSAFRPVSQLIRTKTLQMALHKEVSIYIDTTSSSAGTLALIDALRKLDYQHIEMWSYFAPIDISLERIQERPRPTSELDFFKKRIGAFTMAPELIKSVDVFRAFFNPNNEESPAQLAVFKQGKFEGRRLRPCEQKKDILLEACQALNAEAKTTLLPKELAGMTEAELRKDLKKAAKIYKNAVLFSPA